MIGAHVALAAGGRPPRDRDRGGVPGVTGRAGTNRSIVIGPANGVALRASTRRRRRALRRGQRMRRAARAARLIAFRELHLRRGEPGLSVDRRPRGRGMPAPEKFLIDRLVTAPAVAGGERRRDDETMMLVAALSVGGLVAIQAVDALLRVDADLVLVNHRVLLLGVAFGAFPGRANERGARLVGFDPRPRAVDQERADNQRKPDHHRDEDRTE